MTADLISALRREGPDVLGGEDLRGLLHDVGHGLATLSYLVEGLREDPDAADRRGRLDLMGGELSRLMQLVDLRSQPPEPAVFDARATLEELVALSAASTCTRITLHAATEVPLYADGASLWRMLSNLVGNAVRAAGPSGTVEVVAGPVDTAATAVEIVDDGPGFGAASGGTAAMGLGLVRGIARGCGASLRVLAAGDGRTRVRMVFSARS